MKEPWKGNKLFHRVQYAAVSPQPLHPLSPSIRSAPPLHPLSPSITLPPPLHLPLKPLISPQY